jgi:long-chain acyl-CoA synthetase
MIAGATNPALFCIATMNDATNSGVAGDRFWLKDYPAGVPAEIDPDSLSSLKRMFEDACRDYASRPAFSNMGRTLSYAEIERASRCFGAWLQKEAGLKKGDRVALMMPNILQYPIAIIGAPRGGFFDVCCNVLLK